MGHYGEVANLPIGKLATSPRDVKQKLVINTTINNIEDLNSNDFLDAVRIVLKYILLQKRKNKIVKYLTEYNNSDPFD